MDTGEVVFQANRVACTRTGRHEQQDTPRKMESLPHGPLELWDGSSLPSRTAQIKVPRPYLFQGEASTAQHIPPAISCPPPRDAARHPYLQWLTVLPWMGSPIDSPLSKGHLAGTPACFYPPMAWSGVTHSPPHCLPPWPSEYTGSCM